MKKKSITLFTVAVLAWSMSMTAFAGTWEQVGSDWKYQKDDHTYAVNGWQWIDSKCYYFDENGVMLANTTTPDGETVDEHGVRVKYGRPVIDISHNGGRWRIPTTIKAEAPTLQDTGLCSFVGKDVTEIEATLGERQACNQISQYMFQSRPAAVFQIKETTNAGALCFRIEAPAAAFFTCSGSDVITCSQLEEALGVEVRIGMAWYEERWYMNFVYKGCDFSIYSCSPEGTFYGDSVMSAINYVEPEENPGFFDESGQWLSV